MRTRKLFQTTRSFSGVVKDPKDPGTSGSSLGLRKSKTRISKKAKVTLAQALRLCTGRTAHRGSRGIALPFHDHGKVHPCTGTEALYRPYGPQGE